MNKCANNVCTLTPFWRTANDLCFFPSLILFDFLWINLQFYDTIRFFILNFVFQWVSFPIFTIVTFRVYFNYFIFYLLLLFFSMLLIVFRLWLLHVLLFIFRFPWHFTLLLRPLFCINILTTRTITTFNFAQIQDTHRADCCPTLCFQSHCYTRVTLCYLWKCFAFDLLSNLKSFCRSRPRFSFWPTSRGFSGFF